MNKSDVRITKYNPIYRHEKGWYTRDEWTDVSDIGKVYLGLTVTEQEYLRVEIAYWETIKDLLRSCGIETMAIALLEMEAHGCDHLSGQLLQESREWCELVRNNMLYGIEDIEKICRLCMRNAIWCLLLGPDATFLDNSEDLYFWFGSDRPFSVPTDAEGHGIYVEPIPAPLREHEVGAILSIEWEARPDGYPEHALEQFEAMYKAQIYE